MRPGMNHEMNHEMRHKMRPARGMRTGSRLLMATLAGGGIAALLTYLIAPKSWNRFTRAVGNAASEGWNQIEESAEWVGTEAQTLYKAVKTEAGVIYDAAGKAVTSAEAAVAGIPQDLQNEKARVDASFEAGRKAYVNGGDDASQKAAAAKAS